MRPTRRQTWRGISFTPKYKPTGQTKNVCKAHAVLDLYRQKKKAALGMWLLIVPKEPTGIHRKPRGPSCWHWEELSALIRVDVCQWSSVRSKEAGEKPPSPCLLQDKDPFQRGTAGNRLWIEQFRDKRNSKGRVEKENSHDAGTAQSGRWGPPWPSGCRTAKAVLGSVNIKLFTTLGLKPRLAAIWGAFT